MAVRALALIFALVLTTYPEKSDAQSLFHGTSVIITANDLMPRNATIESASFYCFATPRGYVSFGWWMGGDPKNIDHSPVSPDPSPGQFDWFEYSSGSCNSSGICHLRAYNFASSKPEHPAFVEDYVIFPFQLGPSERELMFLSYFDREHGKTAVGVRSILQGKECQQAFATLTAVVRQQKLPIEFELENRCGEGTLDDSTGSKQTVMRTYLRARTLAGLAPLEL